MDRVLQRDVDVPPVRLARRDAPPRRCHACGYDGLPLDGSIAAIEAAIDACERHLQRINASRRDSYREPVDGTTRTIKHTRREVERRLARLTRTLRWLAASSGAGESGGIGEHALRRVVSDDVVQAGLACPRCGACDDAASDDETRERRIAFVREMLGSAVGHAGGVDPMELERRVWQLAAKYIT